jgi:hypothetical protein
MSLSDLCNWPRCLPTPSDPKPACACLARLTREHNNTAAKTAAERWIDANRGRLGLDEEPDR